MGFYASSFWYSMGHARLCGGVIILLASYFRYLEFYSKLFDTLSGLYGGNKTAALLRTLRKSWKS